MWSKAGKHLVAEEVIESTIHPSIRDIKYLKWYVFAVLLGVVNAALLSGNLPVESFLPQWVGSHELWLGFSIPLILAGITEIRRRLTWYHFTDRKIMKESGILNKHFTTIHYTNITETQLRQPVYKQALNVGDIPISTAGKDGVEMVVSGVRNPEEYNVMLGSKSTVAHLPHNATAPKKNSSISASSLEAELERIQRRRKDLERVFSNKNISKYEYNRQWFMLEGEERLVQHFLQRLGKN